MCASARFSDHLFPREEGKGDTAMNGPNESEHQRSRNLPPGGLAADGGDRDMPHRRVGLGAVPMALTGLDVHDITDIDLTLLALVCHHAGARGHDQHLVAVMGMPSRGAALAEVHHAAVIVGRVSRLNDRLARPGNRACVPFYRLSAFHWDIRYVFECDHLHDDLSSFLSGIEDIRNPVSPHTFGSATGNLSRPVVTVAASGIHLATDMQGAAMP